MAMACLLLPPPHCCCSSSSVPQNIKKPYLSSGYPLAAPIVRLPTYHKSISVIRVSRANHRIAAPQTTTLTIKKRPYLCPSFLSTNLGFLRTHESKSTSSSSSSSSSSSEEFICRGVSSSSSSSSSSYQSVVPAKDRIISAVAYLLPFFNGLNFGVFLFDRFPILEIAFDPLVPLFSFYKSIPGANFMAFLALCFGVVRDRGFSRYVRRNALQATMLDVLLALPSLVNIVFDSNKGLKFRLLEISYGATFLVIVTGFLYAFGLSVLGRNPSFPFVSEAVDWQLSAVDRQF